MKISTKSLIASTEFKNLKIWAEKPRESEATVQLRLLISDEKYSSFRHFIPRLKKTWISILFNACKTGMKLDMAIHLLPEVYKMCKEMKKDEHETLHLILKML
jgi:hypothetical protein